MPWLTWRAKEIATLYAELNASVHEAAPKAKLALVTPSLDGGPAGSEARRVDRAALPPSHSWRSVGLDLQTWPNGPGAPLILRGTALSTEALSHDLATSPDLDSLVASRLERGLLLGIGGDGSPDDDGETSPGAEKPGSRTAQAGPDDPPLPELEAPAGSPRTRRHAAVHRARRTPLSG